MRGRKEGAVGELERFREGRRFWVGSFGVKFVIEYVVRCVYADLHLMRLGP